MGKNADMLLNQVENIYGITSEEVLSLYSGKFRSNPDEIKLLMELIPEITPEGIFSTVKEIKNPNPLRRFVSEINEITIYDKEGNIKSEPKDWIKFGDKWYNKREILK